MNKTSDLLEKPEITNSYGKENAIKFALLRSDSTGIVIDFESKSSVGLENYDRRRITDKIHFSQEVVELLSA